MKDLSNINRIHKIRKPIWNRIRSFKYISVPLFLLRPTTENYEIPTRKNFRLTKYPREKISDPQNTHEKNFGTNEKKFLNPGNTHKKKFWTHKIPTKKILEPRNTKENKFWTNEIPTRKNFGPTKYS